MATPTSIKLDDELKSRVQHLAKHRQRSAHWLMLEAIEQYVEREERREAFKQDTLKAWEDSGWPVGDLRTRPLPRHATSNLYADSPS
jgi:predicted transcriptional regulator